MGLRKKPWEEKMDMPAVKVLRKKERKSWSGSGRACPACGKVGAGGCINGDLICMTEGCRVTAYRTERQQAALKRMLKTIGRLREKIRKNRGGLFRLVFGEIW